MPGPLSTTSAAAFDVAARPAVVMDNGTGYTKMGFSGNQEVCSHVRPKKLLPIAKIMNCCRFLHRRSASLLLSTLVTRHSAAQSKQHFFPRKSRCVESVACLQPTFVIPTVVGNPDFKGRGDPLNDLGFCIGDEAISKAASSALTYPIRQGTVNPHPSPEPLAAGTHPFILGGDCGWADVCSRL